MLAQKHTHTQRHRDRTREWHALNANPITKHFYEKTIENPIKIAIFLRNMAFPCQRHIFGNECARAHAFKMLVIKMVFGIVNARKKNMVQSIVAHSHRSIEHILFDISSFVSKLNSRIQTVQMPMAQ